MTDTPGLGGTSWFTLTISRDLTAGNLRKQLENIPDDCPIHLFGYLADVYTNPPGVQAFRLPVKVRDNRNWAKREQDIIKAAEIESGIAHG